MSKMIGPGPGCRIGSGHKTCDCCNVPPGKNRRERRRNLKRSERNNWRRLLRREGK